MYEQHSRINCSIWLDASQRSRDGLDFGPDTAQAEGVIDFPYVGVFCCEIDH